MEFSSYVTNLATKLNLYIIPQYIWLVTTYYLMINVTYKYFLNIFQDDREILNSIPKEAIQFNTLVLGEIDKWLPLLWFLSISFIFSALFVGLIEHLPFFKYERVAEDGKYGMTLGIWLFFIASTIEIYHFTDGFFPLFLLGLTLIKMWIENRAIVKSRYTNY